VAWKRRFVEWNQSPLEYGLKLLLGDRAKTKRWDLSDSIAIVPSRFAERSLAQRLHEAATQQEAEFIPPRFARSREFEALFVATPSNVASYFESRLAWLQTFRTAKTEVLSKILRRIPADDDWTNWNSLSFEAAKLRRILGHQRLSIEKASRMEGVQSSATASRWEGLAELEEQYRDRLKQCDLIDQFDYFEERMSDSTPLEPPFARILLVAVPRLSSFQQAILSNVAETCSILSMIFASKTHESGFDGSGCLNSRYWRGVETRVPDERIIFADSPTDEVKASLAELSRRSTGLSPREVAFGIADEEVLPRLVRHAARVNLSVSAVENSSFERWLPLALLRQLTRYRADELADDFASLVRHPDLLHWMMVETKAPGKAAEDFLKYLDEYRSTQLPLKLPLSKLNSEHVKPVIQRLQALLLTVPNEYRWLGEWIGIFESVMAVIYPTNESSLQSSETSRALHALATTFSALKSSSDELLNKCSAEEALSILDLSLEEHLQVGNEQPSDVRALPWDDLMLSDAQLLFVLGMNEGRLPPYDESSVFLSSEIRRDIFAPGSVEEGAWHRYLLCSLVHAHPQTIFVIGKRSADGDPYLIHRLLLDGTAEEKAERLLRFFRSSTSKIEMARPPASPIQIRIPAPEPRPPIDELPVTAFRDYLACPYRFYLRHVMKLKRMDDEPAELDPLSFGNLIHDILHGFGTSRVASSQNKEEILAHLETLLLKATKDRFEESLPAVAVQVEQIQARLEAYASWQARWAAEGWRIAHVEITTKQRSAYLSVDEKPFYLSGRIDRIDVNSRTGQIAVMDYKTSESGDPPQKTHRNTEGWIDLQLPLYRHLLPAIAGLGDEIKNRPLILAYMVLPKDVGKVSLLQADWNASDLNDADETAAEIIRGIRNAKFSRMSFEAADKFPEFARICQDGMVTHD